MEKRLDNILSTYNIQLSRSQGVLVVLGQKSKSPESDHLGEYVLKNAPRLLGSVDVRNSANRTGGMTSDIVD